MILTCGAILLIILYILEVDSSTRAERKSFTNFKSTYNKKYSNKNEDQRRLQIYLQNAAYIRKHNLNRRAGHETFTMALNEYADMTAEEFQSMSQFKSLLIDIAQGATFIAPFNVKPPNAIDWRELGAVTPVRKQNKCGSCWAFSSAAALEGQHFRKTSKLITLSVQNLVDCVPLRNNANGCKGGSMERSFIYIHDNDGIATEESYPYQAVPNNECQFNESSIVGATVKGFVNIPKGDESALALAVGTIGPISVAINSKCTKIQFFKAGIFNDEDCGATARLNHAVLLVGYGYDNETNLDYWIVKNSWGIKWGMHGYMHIPRFRNYAGIANRASYPLV